MGAVRRVLQGRKATGCHLILSTTGGCAAAVLTTAIPAVALASRFGTDPQLVASPLIGQVAPEVTLPRLAGDGDLSLDDLDGHVVVVNFWASWCVACRG